MPNVRIVRFDDNDLLKEDLAKWVEYNRSLEPNKKLSLSKFLAKASFMDRVRGKSSDDEVVVDLSGHTIPKGNYQDLDFGEVILNNTTFTECTLTNAKIQSKAGMEGLKFLNGCTLTNASIEGDIGGVLITGATNVNGLDLTKTTGFAQCMIDKDALTGRGIKLPFSSHQAFARYMSNVPIPPDLSKYNLETQAAAIEPEPDPQVQRKSIATLFREDYSLALKQAGAIIKRAKEAGKSAAQLAQDLYAEAHKFINEENVPVTKQAAWEDIQSLLSKGVDFVTEGTEGLKSRLFGTPKEIQEDGEEIFYDAKGDPEIEAVPPARGSSSEVDKPPLFECLLGDRDLSQISNTLTSRDLLDWNSQVGAETLEEFAKRLEKEPIVSDQKIENITFEGKNFGQVTFAGCHFSHCKFSKGSDLQKVSILESQLENTEFDKVLAEGMVCRRSKLLNSKIKNANMDRANFAETHFVDSDIDNTRLQNSVLHRADFRNVTISTSYLDNAQIDHTTGEGLKLSRVSAQHADFTSSKLLKSKMEVVDLEGSVADNLAMPESEISGLNLNGVKASYLQLQQSKLDSVTARGADLNYSDFSGPNTKISKFSVTDGADLRNSKFMLAELSDSEITETKASCINLNGATISRTKIIRSDLSHSKMQTVAKAGGELQSVTFEESEILDTSLKNAKMQQSQIKNTQIQDTNMSGAKLNESKISGGCLDRSNLTGIDLSSASLGAAEMPTSVSEMLIDSTANLEDLKLSEDLESEKIKVNYYDEGQRKVGKVVLKDIKEKSASREKIINMSTSRSMFNGLMQWLGGGVKSAGSGAEELGNSIIKKHTSKTGAMLGALAGIAMGAGIIAATAATLGGALLPVAAIVMGSLAASGGIAGHVLEHTSPGRRLFMGATTVASTMAYGVYGLLAVPSFIAYNVWMGKSNAISRGIGDSLRGFGRLLKSAGANIVGGFYTNEEIVSANYVKDAREANRALLTEENLILESQNVDEKENTRTQVRRFLTRPSAKRGKKEAEIGIVHVGGDGKASEAAPAPSAPPAPRYRLGPMGAFFRWKNKVFGKKRKTAEPKAQQSEVIPSAPPLPEYVESDLREAVGSMPSIHAEDDARSMGSSKASTLTDLSGWSKASSSHESAARGALDDDAITFYSTGSVDERGIEGDSPEKGTSGLSAAALAEHDEAIARSGGQKSFTERLGREDRAQSLSDIREKGPQSPTAKRRNSLDPKSVKARLEAEKKAPKKKGAVE